MQYVTIRVEGRIIVEVDDDLDIDEAAEVANEFVENADFGPYDDNVSPLEDIDWHCVHIESESGKRIYY